ncbi:hypothetical protein [Erwinia sorbitola]|uniref:Uncharacterized protein n=1 Tax=Erwinia sorbitola TaxID=2681984 RepID=A0A6I6EEU0_9GAMM|nr:hypothetical protein [Erwinia sorbitola]QGU87058.1 hypothetical protein GN242_07440 [Erwinia sorbitola]
MSKNNSFVIYNNDGEHGRMYFTGTEWGGPGYFNRIGGAYLFDTMAEAEDVRSWLDEALVLPQEHFIEEVINE